MSADGFLADFAPMIHRDHPLVAAIAKRIADRDDAVTLDIIQIAAFRRGNGLGTAALRDICRLADIHEVEVHLTADESAGGEFPRLIRWYSRHGFYMTRLGTNRSADMTRLPQGVPTSAEEVTHGSNRS